MPNLRLFLVLVFLAHGSVAESENVDFFELLIANPELKAAEATAKADRIDVKVANSQRLPKLSVSGRTGYLDSNLTVPLANFEQTFNLETSPHSAELVLEQALYTSGAITSSISAAAANADASDQLKNAIRQEVILAGATAMANLVRDRGALQVRQQNEDIIRQRLAESNSRFDVGLATKTDVLQSESRYAASTAESAIAQSNLYASEQAFYRLFGVNATGQLRLPAIPTPIPGSLDSALSIAQRQAPQLLSQRNSASAAAHRVKEARGLSLPQVSLSAQAATAKEQILGQSVGDSEQYGVFLNVSVDLFAGGENRARIKAAKQRSIAAQYNLEQVQRRVRQTVADNWNARLASIAALQARRKQVRAAELSRDGVVKEAEANRRTRLDVLDAELELANAQVSRLEAQRDAIVAEFALLATLGEL
ncbi:MAG: TolC family outer membrane protein [Pseudomonadota bacterium]